MKEIISAVSIFLLIGIFSFMTITFTDRNVDILIDYTTSCEADISSGDWENAEAKTEKARERFVKISHTLESYLLHEDIERLSDILTNIEVAVKLRENVPALSNIRIFIRRLYELSEDDKLTFNNIL